MGLTSQSTGMEILQRDFDIVIEDKESIVVALAGNPNTGKSTLFNTLTGLRQHTGNWPGKTVASARGNFSYKGQEHILVDLPGTYSLLSSSVEEEVARDFICFGRPHVTVVVADGTSLQRNLNLVFQIMEITPRVVLCVNLMDEAKKKGITIDLGRLEKILGIPVIGTSARRGYGLRELKGAILRVAKGDHHTQPLNVSYGHNVEEAIGIMEESMKVLGVDDVTWGFSPRWAAIRLLDGDSSLRESLIDYINLDERGIELSNKNIKNSGQAQDGESENIFYNEVERARGFLYRKGIDEDGLRDIIVTKLIEKAEATGDGVIHLKTKEYNKRDHRIDSVLTSKTFGIPIMIFLLGVIFWITIEGANYPSELLAKGFFWLEDRLTFMSLSLGIPNWIYGILVLVLGVYRTLGWVISVMLPPMAIFFPLFTLLEDLGYLPRIAFNLDNFFKKACAHGKQALTMCMGFGCNAAGIIACRIIDSPRERLIAIITNNFVPCNGRFPIFIALSTIFLGGLGGIFASLGSALAVLFFVVLGVIITLGVSRLLSKTVLKGLPSSFTLELPPYRRPQIGKILIRSLLDRTLFVLGRAVIIAAPAGLIIWLMANLTLGGISLLDHSAGFLDPFGRLLGMDGYIILAFILGFPANEIVIPIIIMSYMATGAMLELDSIDALRQLLIANGWTYITALCTMLFSLNHFPCGTTLLTIYKETQSPKWTFLSFLIPTLTGILICFVVAQGARVLGFV